MLYPAFPPPRFGCVTAAALNAATSPAIGTMPPVQLPVAVKLVPVLFQTLCASTGADADVEVALAAVLAPLLPLVPPLLRVVPALVRVVPPLLLTVVVPGCALAALAIFVPVLALFAPVAAPPPDPWLPDAEEVVPALPIPPPPALLLPPE